MILRHLRVGGQCRGPVSVSRVRHMSDFPFRASAKSRSRTFFGGDSTNSRAHATPSSGPRRFFGARRSLPRDRNALGSRSCFESWNAGSTWRWWRIDRYCSVMSRTVADSLSGIPFVSCEIRTSSRKRSQRVTNGRVDKAPPRAITRAPCKYGRSQNSRFTVAKFFFANNTSTKIQS